jgi:uncharacterized protein
LRECGEVAFLYRLLPPRATFAQDMSSAEADVMQRHVAYWQDLLDRNVAVAFGPVLDPEDPWGLGVLDLEDEQAARATGASAPAVESGTCTYRSCRCSSCGDGRQSAYFAPSGSGRGAARCSRSSER